MRRLPYNPLAYNAYVAMLAERELRGLKGYLARRGLLQRLIRLSKDMAVADPTALFFAPGEGLPRTWQALEAVAKRRRNWALRRGATWVQRPKLAPQPAPPEPSRWLSVGQAAKALGVSPRTVAAWCDAGRLAHQRLPSGHRRLDRTGVEGAWQQQPHPTEPPDIKALEARLLAACAVPDSEPPQAPRRRR